MLADIFGKKLPNAWCTYTWLTSAVTLLLFICRLFFIAIAIHWSKVTVPLSMVVSCAKLCPINKHAITINAIFIFVTLFIAAVLLLVYVFNQDDTRSFYLSRLPC